MLVLDAAVTALGVVLCCSSIGAAIGVSVTVGGAALSLSGIGLFFSHRQSNCSELADSLLEALPSSQHIL